VIGRVAVAVETRITREVIGINSKCIFNVFLAIGKQCEELNDG
jgi:hypothetical protein